jgi:hypothetical protein
MRVIKRKDAGSYERITGANRAGRQIPGRHGTGSGAAVVEHVDVVGEIADRQMATAIAGASGSRRAEQWLHRVYNEIEDRFLRQSDGRDGVPQRRRA